MEVALSKNGRTLIAKVSGDINTNTAPLMLDKIHSSLEGISSLQIDFADVPLCSSAGLRVLLQLDQEMSEFAGMIITNVNDVVTQIFKETGLINVFNVQ